MKNNIGRVSLTNRYLSSLLVPVGIAGVILLTWPLFQPHPLIPYLPAVVLSSWYGGLGPGLVSLVISFLLADFMFIGRHNLPAFLGMDYLPDQLTFTGLGSSIYVMSELTQRDTRPATGVVETPPRTHTTYLPNDGPTHDTLREAERKYRDIFENAGEGIFQSTPDGRYIAANPALAHIFGFASPEELIRSRQDISLQVYVDPKRREEFKSLLEKHGAVRGFECQMFRKDGSKIWVSVNARAVRHGDGVNYYEGTGQDITDRKHAELELVQQKEILEKIVDHLPLMINFTDGEGQLKLVNREWQNTLGWSLEELRRQEINAFAECYPDEEYRREVANFISAATGEWRDFKTRTRDGLTIDTSWARVKLSDGTTIGIGQDVTERKRSDEALKLFRNLIDQSSDAIEVLDPDTLRFIDCNTTAHEVLGYTREEFLSLSAFDVDPAIDENKVANFQADIDSAGFKIFESVHRRKDGSTFPIEINAKTIKLEKDYRLAVVRDITERKAAEEALRRAERKYRDIFENAGEGIFQSTPEGRYLEANPTFAGMHGFDSPEELILSRTDISQQVYVDPTRRQEFKRLLEKNGAVRGFEHQVYKKDAGKIWISVNARAVKDQDGTIKYYEGTAQDITAHRQAQQALRKSEERYRELFENARDANYVHDLDGTYTSVNRAAEKLTGYSREEILGKRFTDFVPPDQIDNIREQLCRKLVEEGETSYESEVFTKDGRRVAVDIRSHLIFENGMPIGVQGTARDITERKRAEQRLGEYEKAVEGLDEMIVVVDRNYRYLLANRAFLKYRGLEMDQLVGRRISEELNSGIFESVIREKLNQCFEGNIVRFEVKYDYPTLGVRNLFISYFPIENFSGIDRAVCVLKDITEAKHAEERIKAVSEQLRALSARLQTAREEEGTRIAREIHDELGSALTTLRWGLEEISTALSTKMSRATIGRVQESMATLTTLIDSTFGTVRRISSELRPGILDEAGLVAAIECATRQFEARSGIVCSLQSNVQNEHVSSEQSTALFRILQEAFTNIQRHASATCVDITLREDSTRLIFRIADNGRGITSNEKAGTKTLGLLGMRERANLVGGAITVQGADGEGTVISVCLPLSQQTMVRTMGS